MWFTLRYLYLVTVVLCIEQPRLENVGQVKQSFNFRRAIDDGRERKYSNHDDDGSYDSYHSAAGYYDSSQVNSGFSDIRNNVPGEPGVDYPAYETVPKTRFSCEGRAHGYYADEESGCQAFHVCHNVVVSSFICPVGAIFSQKLLTCDWWNRVDCTSTVDYQSSRQGIRKDTNEMVQKAYEMTVLPESNGIRSDPQIGRKQYYNYNPTDQFGVYENLQLRENKAIVNDNEQSQKNIINVNLQPKNFEVNQRAQNSGLENREDSSIVYIQKNFNYNPQDSYPTLQPSRLENNFQNSYQQNEKFVRYEFQPSYAPTVPTVTTTTRKLYSPTVPTTYRPSTISYNKDDQYFDGSNHFYTHGRDVISPTTRPTIDYDDVRVHDGRFENPTYSQRRINQQSVTADKRHDKYDFAEIVQSKESIGIAQSYRGILNGRGNNREEETRSQSVNNLQVGESKEQDAVLLNFGSNLETIRTPLGTQPTNTNPNVSGNQQDYQHFYTNQLNSSRRQAARAIATGESDSAGNDTQAGSTENTTAGKSLNSINSRLGISPLIVQIPRPSGSPGRPLTDIADQLFTFDSFVKMSNSPPQTSQSALSNTNSTDVNNRIQSSDSSTRVPPLIPPFSQSATATGSQTPSVIDDDGTFDSLPKIPPLMTDFPLSSGSTDVDDQLQGLDPSTGIPPLIPQSSQSATSTGPQTMSVIDNDETFDSSPKIPPLISDFPLSSGSTDVNDQSQGFNPSTRIPPLIPQSSQSATSTGPQTTSVIANAETLNSSPQVPPLFSEIPQSSDSTDVDDQPQSFESSTRIPPLIPPFPQSATSTEAQTPSVIDDDDTFDSPSKIPPLIPDFTSSSESTDVGNQPQSFESSTRTPPLIPPFPQSATATGSQTPSVFNDDDTFDSPSKIPPLIPDFTSSSESTDVGNQPQSFESSTRIPPLIPPFPQSATATGSQTPSVFDDDDTFDSPSKIPPLIPDFTSSSESTDVGNQPQSFESSTRTPPLIPPFPQSATATGSQTPSVFNDDDTFDSPSKIPPLIPDFTSSSESTDVGNQPQSFESSTRIPPLIPPFPQSATSTEPQRPSVFDDDDTFDSPSKIPPLIPDFTSSSESTDVGNQPQSFESSTRIPPLIPPFPQSATATGSQTPSVIDDDETFDSLPKIPPLISDIPLSSGSTDVDDQLQGLDSSTGTLPLIPQSSQSATSTGSQTTSVIDNDETFDLSPKIPPLISDFPLTSVSTDVNDQSQGFNPSTRIPPLIPQSSQSAASSGPQTTSVIENAEKLNSSPQVPPLFSEIPQSLESTDRDDQSQRFDSSTRIPPLIQQSATSTEPQTTSVIDDFETFDSQPKIPPLMSDLPLSSGSTDVDNQSQGFEPSTKIPPLISQSSQFATSTGQQTTSVIDNDETFDSSPKIQPLMSDLPLSFGSTDIDKQSEGFESTTRLPPLIQQSPQSAISTGLQTMSVIDEDKTFDSPLKIPPLISDFSPTFGSMDVNDQSQDFDLSTGIPPLISQSPQSATSTRPQTTSVIDDDDTFDSPSKIPPLIPDFKPSPESTDVGNQPQSFESSTRIPPLIPQSSQSATSAGSQTPSVINDDDLFSSPSKIPPLIPNYTQHFGSVNVDNGPQSFEIPNRIPPLISQSSPFPTLSGPQSPSGIDNNKRVDSPPKLIPLISPSLQSHGSSGLGSMVVIERPQTYESSTRIPPVISQSLPSLGSSEADPTRVSDSKNKSHLPPRVPPFSSRIPQSLGLPGAHFTNIFDQKPTLYPSDNAPPSFLPPSRPVYSSGTYSSDVFKSFNSFPSTTQPSYFTFRGQYQSPLPFGGFQRPTQLPEHQFVTTSTAKIPAYDFNVEYGSKLSLETSTHRPSGGIEYPSKEFRINVPDFPITEETYSTQSSILSTPEYPYLSGASNSKTSVDQSPSVDTINKMPYVVTSHGNHSDFLIPTEQNANEHIQTVVKGPTPTISIPNVNHRDNNLFNQVSTTISSILDPQKPNSPDLGPGHWAENNDDLRYTIGGALLNSTATPSPSSNRISNTYLPQSNESSLGAPGRVFDAKQSNVEDGSIHLSYPENPSHKEYQESTTPNIIDKVTPLGPNFVPISSPAYSGNFGYPKERFESSTPNVLDTTYIKSAEKLNTSGNELLQAFGTSGLSSNLPSGISQIQPSLNNHDSPYEIHFTVNANEEFNPSEDFINKLLAQHASNSPLGFDGFGGFEIIKSETPEDPDNAHDVNSSVLPNIEPSVAPNVPRLFDVRGSFGNNPSQPHNGFSNQNSNLSPSIQTVSETFSTGIEQLKSNNFARPFFFNNNQDVALQTGLKSANPSIIKLPLSDSNVQPERWQDGTNLSNLQVEPEDINRSLETLFEFGPQNFESSPLAKEQILEQLNQHFGQPLYTSDSQRNLPLPEASHNVNDIVSQVAKLPSPVPPTPSIPNTPEPVKTIVQTEFIPALSFSFDSDEGRKEYIDAVLQGLLAESKPVDHWTDDTNPYRETRENLKPRNHTTKT